MLGNHGGSGSRLPARQRKNKIGPGNVQYNSKSNTIRTIHRVFSLITLLATRAWLQPELQERRLFTVGDGRFVNQVHDRKGDSFVSLHRRPDEISADGNSSKRSRTTQNPLPMLNTLSSVSVWESRIQYLCDPQWFRDTASRGPTTIAAPQPRSAGFLKHRLEPGTSARQYNQDLGLIHSTNGNHLESPNEGSSIDHQVTIYLHAQNITMFPTNETWYFASQILVSSSGGLILILTAQSTRN
ncbi:hypothetical protein F511_22107 [Dorcoceras hygrometricum]|uniref:Uncharacterized protein n=1 Tax=Dorcoceras hygrometricum TaxID=472368 RepID=A0A2Z7BXJ3_9LAMI|nr:hypothetical protein F511_22107 [Dorcoceras hygrometricum]